MFGLMTTTQLDAYKSLNNRRRIFYQFPNGAAPLTGLLSLMDSEETDKPEFGWYEDRLDDQKTTTAAISSGNGPFSASGSDTPATTSGFNIAANDVIRIRTATSGTNKFRPNMVLWLRRVKLSGSVTTDLIGVIQTIVATNKVEIRVLSAKTGVGNTDSGTAATDNTGLSIIVIGTANPEGGRSGKGLWLPPVNPGNYTQIFRDAMVFSRTVLQEGLLFDKTGIYRGKARQTAIRHMVQLEKAFLFGERQSYITQDDGDDTPIRTMGGVLWFLRQWEAGTTYGNTAATVNSDANKRIIDVNGTMTKRQYNQYLARVFKVTNNVDYSKLCLCGGGFLGVINDMFEKQLVFQTGMQAGDSYRMNLTMQETMNGTIYYKTHPLFNQYSDLEYSALFLDIPNMQYRPLSDSDTVLLKNRQENDEDKRKDEWMTEASLELRMPESFMFMDTLTGLTLT